MKIINITVPSSGNITPFEIHRAIANREEYLSGFSIPLPKMTAPRSKVTIKEGAGLWNFITGCLP
jgi:hypothetical protein